MKKIKFLLLITVMIGLSGWTPLSFLSFASPSFTLGSDGWLDQEMRKISLQAGNIDAEVLKLSLAAYSKARHLGLDDKQLLTIIDYSKPSTERRLWVVDVQKAQVLFNTWVSHGKNSGELQATSFSNTPGSLKSSLGVFLTDQTYIGGKGYSLRLKGLEQGVNDNAYKRDIVVHGAWYADPKAMQRHGQIGRSWGCPAVSPALAMPLINTIKDKTLVVAYYPDKKWLNGSTFLAG